MHRAILGPIAYVAAAHAGRQLDRFQRLCRTCVETQYQRLMQILRNGSDSEFGRRHHFDRVRSYRDFTAAMPLAQYAYFSPYIDRCQMGEVGALLGPSQRLVMFALTSGTTGPYKAIPVTRQFIAAYRWGWNVWGIKVIQDYQSPLIRKVLQISSPAEEKRTPSGIPCGSISGMLARNQKRIVRRLYATPYEVTDIADPDLRNYAIMRLAVPQDIGLIVTANPSTLVALAQTAEGKAESLIRDVRDGTLERILDLPMAIQSALRCCLRPDPDGARRLECLLDRHGSLLPRHYWDSSLLGHWTGGTVGLYLSQVRRYYGDGPIRDIGLLASEGRMSLPLEDYTAAGVLDITSMFFEFVPEEQINNLNLTPDAPTLPQDLTALRAEQLDVGGRYYIFLTNGAGLYRYHIGDVVRMTGWMDSTPVIEFLSKGVHTSSLTGEKLTEHQVVAALNAAFHQVGLEPISFVMAPVWGDPPHYRLFVETLTPPLQALQQALAQCVESNLMAGNGEYASRRRSRRLNPLQVCFVRDGELSRHDRQLILDRRGRSEQFKHRFLINDPIREGEPGSRFTPMVCELARVSKESEQERIRSSSSYVGPLQGEST